MYTNVCGNLKSSQFIEDKNQHSKHDVEHRFFGEGLAKAFSSGEFCQAELASVMQMFYLILPTATSHHIGHWNY